MDQINLTFNLTVAQVNIILKYLGAGSFVEVEPLITAIRDQAAPQIQMLSKPLDSGINSDEE